MGKCRWLELTTPEFVEAVGAVCGVCLVPVGVIEKHGDHLPLGTDSLVVEQVAEDAVAEEPALLFPTLHFSQIAEARHVAGTIALRHEVYWNLLDNLCDEIARNGCRRIVLLNGHGGNEGFLSYFAMTRLERIRPYSLYVIRLGDYMQPALASPEWQAQMQSAFDHHGGEAETSSVMAVRPELVNLAARSVPGLPRGSLAHLPRVLVNGIWWYADYPRHYAGDAAAATREKGQFLLPRWAAAVAAVLRAVKADEVTARLEAEFFKAAADPLAGP
ncbi:MAG: Creatinine amidohydrolase [Lentisphaerae bacterium ADurb.BinA184]|nr:MAG: Creatinine amidohydrolase [Lentisphaerae bacterium ADurb.BinA184]